MASTQQPNSSETSGRSGEQLQSAASRMGLATLMSRVLGLAREQVFAFLFGASDAADAFNIAFRIPNLLRDLFAEGAMSAAFVPVFTRTLHDDPTRNRAYFVLGSVLKWLLLVTGGLAVVGIFFSEQLVGLYAGSFKSVPGKLELATALTQQMFPFFPLVAMAAVLMGALNSLGAFFLPAFAPVLFNVASIFFGLVVAWWAHAYYAVPKIYAMAWGVVVGGFLQFFVQWWQVRRLGFSWRHFVTPDAARAPVQSRVREVLLLMIPGTIGLAATQSNILINSMFATSQGSGAVSWLNYAFRLMQFPIGIFGVSLAAATLPQVSRALAAKKIEDASLALEKSVRLCLAINLPAALGMCALSLPITQLLFQRGAFGMNDSLATQAAILAYSVGLPGYSLVKILVPLFYAHKNTKVPVVLSFVMVALNALLNALFLFVLQWPFWSLAVATSVTSTLNALFLFWYLEKHHLPCGLGSLLKNAALNLVVACVVGLVAYLSYLGIYMFVDQALPKYSYMIFAKSLTAIFCGMGAAFFTWWGVSYYLGLMDVVDYLEAMRKKVVRRLIKIK